MKFMELLEYELLSVKTYTDPTSYILTPRAFSMNPLWSFLDLLIYILANKGKYSTLEIEDFVENYFDGDEGKLITKQDLSQQKMKLNFNVFKYMNKKFITKFYQSEEYTSHFKDHIVLLIDESKSEIPNTPETKESFNIYENSLTNKKALRTLFSTIIDVKYGIILDSILGNADSSERELAKEHIKNLKDIIDFKQTILVFDAEYYSLELKLFLDKLNIKYIFRLPPNTYKNEINKMTTMDEILKISNTTSRRQNIQDENLLNTAKKLPYIESKI